MVSGQSPFIQVGVALTPVISNCPPKVLAYFLSFPSNFYLSFYFIAVVFWSNLLLTCEYLTNFSSLIFTYFYIKLLLPVSAYPILSVFHLRFITFSSATATIEPGFFTILIC